MSVELLYALSPLLGLAGSVVVSLLLVTFSPRHRVVWAGTLLGLLGALAVVPVAARSVPAGDLLVSIKLPQLIFVSALLAAAWCVTLLSAAYLEHQQQGPGEYYLLVQLATLGAAVLVVSAHFAALFLGLELLSAALFGLVGYRKRSALGLEAAIKYLVLAGTASSLLLLGIAYFYATTGSLGIAALGSALQARTPSPLLLASVTLIVAGVAFKLALVPFHLWTPDVYEGAPAPVTALLATVSKGAVLGVLLFQLSPVAHDGRFSQALAGVAGLSMLAGNLLALGQTHLKRILAYSSIAHFGYFLTGMLAFGRLSAEAVTFYFIAYALSTLLAFSVVIELSRGDLVGSADAVSNQRENEAPVTLESVEGLCWRRPWLGAALVVSLLSLGGLPLTAGFVGKFYVVTSALGGIHYGTVVALVVGSAIGIFYYLRIAVRCFAPVASGRSARPIGSSLQQRLLFPALAGVLFALGAYPVPLQKWLGHAFASTAARTDLASAPKNKPRKGNSMPQEPTRADIDRLTEPTRSKALDILQRLRRDGYDEARAVELAFRQAEEWETSRQPGTTPPVESARMAEVRVTQPDSEGER